MSRKQAIAKAERAFEEYRAKEMQQLESDFDRAVKQLNKKARGTMSNNAQGLLKVLLLTLLGPSFT